MEYPCNRIINYNQPSGSYSSRKRKNMFEHGLCKDNEDIYETNTITKICFGDRKNVNDNARHDERTYSTPPVDDRYGLKLDLADDIFPPCFNTLLRSTNSPILASPELHMLKLASPELENLIISQDSINNIADEDFLQTKNRNSRSKLKSPISSTANANQHKERYFKGNATVVSPIISAQDLQFITETNDELEYLLPSKSSERNKELHMVYCSDFDSEFLEPLQQVPNLNRLNLSSINNNNNQTNNGSQGNKYHEDEVNQSSSFYEQIEEHAPNQRKYEKKKISLNEDILENYIPSEQETIKLYIEDHKGHSPLPQINLEVQEIIKRERKKLKNRVAASKCRKKKLEREAQLEIQVNHLTQRSVELSSIAHALRNQATDLKQRIMEHLNAGCNINLNTLLTEHDSVYI